MVREDLRPSKILTRAAFLNAVVVIAVVIWLLQVFGLLEQVENFRIGK